MPSSARFVSSGQFGPSHSAFALKGDSMRRIVAVLLALIFASPGFGLQVPIGCGGGGGGGGFDPPPPPSCPGSTTTNGAINTSYGYYQWQVDQLAGTTTLTSETGFTTPPGLVQIPVTLACSATVHEVHGNLSFGVFQSGTCGTGTIIAQVLDQRGNAIASMNLIQFGQSSANLSVKGTFPTALSVTALTLQFYVSQCGPQVASWSLTMS
jgi:hypothetical protein